jgi:hypothetical protein
VIQSSLIYHIWWFSRINSCFFVVTGKNTSCFLVWHSFRHPVLHKNARQVGGYGIGGQWWTNRAHGFCLSSPSPATKLKTTRFQLSKEGAHWVPPFC